MKWLFWQVWFWCLLSFLLGALVTFLVLWLLRRRVTETGQGVEVVTVDDQTTTDAESGMDSSMDGAVDSGMDSAVRNAVHSHLAGPEPEPEPEPFVDETPTGRIPVLSLDDVDATPAEAVVEAGSYPNSAKPLADGAAPSEEYVVKGNAGSMLFHTADSPYYARTRAEVWFRTTADAEAAGFTGWNRRRSTAKAGAATRG